MAMWLYLASCGAGACDVYASLEPGGVVEAGTADAGPRPIEVDAGELDAADASTSWVDADAGPQRVKVVVRGDGEPPTAWAIASGRMFWLAGGLFACNVAACVVQTTIAAGAMGTLEPPLAANGQRVFLTERYSLSECSLPASDRLRLVAFDWNGGSRTEVFPKLSSTNLFADEAGAYVASSGFRSCTFDEYEVWLRSRNNAGANETTLRYQAVGAAQAEATPFARFGNVTVLVRNKLSEPRLFYGLTGAISEAGPNVPNGARVARIVLGSLPRAVLVTTAGDVLYCPLTPDAEASCPTLRGAPGGTSTHGAIAVIGTQALVVRTDTVAETPDSLMLCSGLDETPTCAPWQQDTGLHRIKDLIVSDGQLYALGIEPAASDAAGTWSVRHLVLR